MIILIHCTFNPVGIHSKDIIFSLKLKELLTRILGYSSQDPQRIHAEDGCYDWRTATQLTWAFRAKPRKVVRSKFMSILFWHVKWYRLQLVSRGLWQKWNDLTRFVLCKDHSEGSVGDLLDFRHISSRETKRDLFSQLVQSWMWQMMMTWNE